MISEKFAKRLISQLNLRKGDNVLHLYREQTAFSKILVETIGKQGKLYAIDVKETKDKPKKENISFYKSSDDLDIESGTLDVIFLEDTIYSLSDLQATMRRLKKYLTAKGKIVINQKKEFFLLSFFGLSQKKKLHETMYLVGFAMKNRFNLTNHSDIEVYEKE
ncbi:MAG: hypothetical protein PF542_05100 [Nanoarchaeota archaeon]|jgi:hypothetical protein|nr:hypothetical protein [Nanoarchaeota archaeon]